MDLNTASVEELQRIEGFGEQRARALIQRREKQGAFGSWDDVSAVPGISAALLQKLKAAASLGTQIEPDVESKAPEPKRPVQQSLHSSDEGQRTAGEATGEQETTAEEEFEEDVDDPEVDALVAMAQMDFEAATAYEVAAELVSKATRETLLAFAQDHHRHVQELARLVTEHGEELLPSESDPSSSVLVQLVSAVGGLGTRETLLSLVASENFTNRAYMTALELITDEAAREVLDRNFGDEQRHLSWLMSECERLGQREEAIHARAHT